MLRKPPPRALLAYSTLYAVVVLASLPLYPYKWHLLLHILGAVVFVGNIIVTAAWMVLAERTRELRVIRFATRAVNRADLLFTGPGVALVLLNGLAIAADRWGGWANFYEHSWIALALALFAASGIVWVAFLMRYQTRMASLSSAAVEAGESLPQEFYNALRRWYVWGVIATALPVASLYLVVAKPEWW